MAEVTGMRNNALPYPVYGVPWAVTYPMLDADGDLVTGATTPDAERSLNGDTFADCTNESVEIATNSGCYYLLLTGAEMTADIVTVIAKSATAGMKTTVLTFYPRKLVSLRAATAAGGAAGSITLDASASAVDDFYNGCLVVGVLDSATEARIITDYTGSSKVAAVTPNWNTTPDSDDTFTVYLPEGRQLNQANVTHVTETAQTAGDLKASLNTIDDFLDTEVAAILADTDDIQTRLPAALVSGRIDASVGAMAANVMTAAAAAADLTTELQSGLATAAALDAVDNFLDTEIATVITMLTGMTPVNGTIGATGNDTTHLHLAGLAYADDGINSMLITIKDVSTGLFYSRWIEDFANTGDLATVATLPFTPEASVDLYWILPVRADVTGGSGLDAAGVRAAVGLASANLDTQLTAIDDLIDTEVSTLTTRLGTPSDLGGGASIAANLVDIEAQTDDIGTAGAGLTALATQASVNTIDDFLDTEVAAIKAKTDNLPASPANEATLTTIAGYLDTEIAAILAAVDTETAAIKAKTDLIPGTIDGKTYAQLVTLFASVLLGKASGLETTTAVYRAVDDSKDRVTATVDADGNRSAVTLDAA